MPDYSAGTASVRITPDATNFLRDLESKLRSMRDPNFTVQIDADTSQGRRETSEWRREEERNAVRVDTHANLAEAVADMARWRREAEARGIEIPVDVDFNAASLAVASWRADQERAQLDVPVDVDTGSATANLARWRQMQEADDVRVRVVVHQQGGQQLGQLEKQLESLRRSDLLRLNVGAFGAAAFQPAITALAEVAAGLQQVSQAGLALPGIFAGAAASVGTLVIGLGGIKDAYDAVSDAASSSGRDQATQAKAAATASNNLRNAIVDEAEAREDVARATRKSAEELRDLRTEQRGGMIDESRAILEAQKAREALLKGDYTDIRDQMLDIAEADQRIIEVRDRNMSTAERLNEINRTGVKGTDEVRDAQERLIRTQQAAAEAQLALATAANEGTTAQDKAAEAMGKLGPNAREVVNTFAELAPQFQQFRTAISDPLLEGKAEEFENFFTAVRPVTERGLANIAAGWNKNISAFFGAVGSERGTGLIDRILGNTGDAQARLTNAISPLIEGIGTLTAAGTDVLPRLADGFGAVMDRFRDFIVAADEDGRLDKWINDGLDGVTSLGNSMLNIGKSFTAITKAVGGGKQFLQWLQDATGRLQTFLNSTEGQAKLKEYFDQGKDALRQLMPFLQELPGMFRAVGEGATLYVGGLLPLLTTVADLLGDHPGLVSVAVAAWLTWKTISPIMGAVQSGINMLNTGVIGIGTNFSGTRAKAEEETSRIDKSFKDAGKEGSGLNKFSRGVGALAFAGGPFGILATTIATVAVPGLMALGDKFDEASEKTDKLNERQLALEQTLDRVTGKMGAQSLDAQITAAQNYAPAGPGSGIAGISEGDAVAAAASLGISPEVYGQALLNNPDAQKQVRDILIKNNLLPEFQANQKLGGTASEISRLTGGAINQDALLQALIGDPAAVAKYTEELTKGAGAASNGDQATAQALVNQYNLAGIAQKLSQTGQQSVLAGGAMSFLTAQMPTGGPTVQRNQAQNGVFSLSGAGKQLLGANGYQVTATGPKSSPDTKYTIVSPPDVDLGPRLPELQAQGIEAKYNEYSRVWELTVPQGSPLVKEGYKTGGPTPGARDQGFLAELHGQEWVHDAETVQTYGRDVMNALWRKQIDPKAIQGLVPGFNLGGPTDPNDPNYVGMATGQTPGGAAPGPVAPNPFNATAPGAINDVTGQATSGFANIGSSLLSQFGVNIPGLQQQGTSGTSGTKKPALTPGLWGLAQAGGDPLKQEMWGQQTLKWLVNDWVGGTIVGGLMNSVLPNVLDSVGLGGILNNPYMSGFTKTLNHFMGAGAQTQGNAALGGVVTMPDGTQIPVEQFLTPTVNGAGSVPLGSTSHGMSLMPNPEGGDIPSSIASLASDFQLQMTSGLDDRPGYHGQGMAADVSNGTDNTPEMLAFANFMADNYAPYIKELIYEDPAFSRNIKDGQFVGAFGEFYTAEQAGRHNNHVHLAVDQAIMKQAAAAYAAQTGGAVPGGAAAVPGSPGFSAFLKQLYGSGSTGSPGLGNVVAGTGAERWRSTVTQIVQSKAKQYGITNAAAWVDDILGQINFESKGDPTAENLNDSDGRGGRQQVFGLGQFLPATFAAHNTTGGGINDPVAQIHAMIDYLASSKYGVIPGGGVNWKGVGWRNGEGYRSGGHTPGSKSTPIPAVLHGDEFVHRNEAVEKYGLDFMNAVNDLQLDPDQIPQMAIGGAARDALKMAMVRPTPVPPPRPTPAITKTPRPVPPSGGQLPMPGAPSPSGPPVAPPDLGGNFDPVPPEALVPGSPPPGPQQQVPGAVYPPAAAQQPPSFAPSGTDGVAPPVEANYTLPWINQAISSGAGVAANLASMAIQAAAAGGSMGMSAAAGGMGAGEIGSLVAGGIQQGGKIVQGVANVISGALVGSVPGSYMTTPEAYGRTLRTEQDAPRTAMPSFSGRSATYNIQGVDTRNMLQELQMRENIDSQAALANHPVGP